MRASTTYKVIIRNGFFLNRQLRSPRDAQNTSVLSVLVSNIVYNDPKGLHQKGRCKVRHPDNY